MTGRRQRRSSKRKTNIKILLFIIFVVLSVSALIVSILSYEDNDVFRNENEFHKFIEYKYENDNYYELMDIENVKYKYDETVSYAVDYSEYNNDRIEEFRDKRISEIIDNYKADLSENDKRVRALIISVDIFEHENGTISLIIHESSSVENNKSMDKGHSDIHTYQLSKSTNDTLVPHQVFYEGYREYCENYFTDYFIKNFDEELVDGWYKYIEANEDNFNDYIVTEEGAIFFFDAGTILDESEGIIYAALLDNNAEPILRDKIIERYIDPSKPMVAITYDDGPGFESEDRILSCLEYNNAVATFFYQGYFIEGREQKIIRALELGCEIGSHTWDHPVLTSLDKKDLIKQFDKTNDAICDACGEYPTVFRPSYGITDKKINKMSELPVIMWDVDTLDWESRNGKKVFNLVKKARKSSGLDGKIILMHSIHDSTADATEMLVPWLKENGYQLVTVSELIKYKTGKDPVPGKVYGMSE